MQKISVGKLKPGMIISRNIFNINGKLLLGAGTIVSTRIIKRIASNNIPAVYIRNPLAGLDNNWLDKAIKNLPQVVSEKTIINSAKKIRKCFSNVCVAPAIDIDNVKSIARDILDEATGSGNAMINLTNIGSYDNQTFVHSANVGVLAAVMGIKLGYERKKLLELTLGGLLHDVGKLLIPLEILTKTDKLTEEEFDIIKHHPKIGFEILRKNIDLPLTSAHVAYQHHEQYNGKGYIRSLKGKKIHEYARIVAVTDVYDALTSDRHYRKGHLPHEAYEIMLSMSANFDQELLSFFLNQLILYPVGITVGLSNGSIGIVEKILPGLQLRPVVKIISEKSGRFPQSKSYSLDLSENLNITITKVFNEDEVCQMMAANQE